MVVELLRQMKEFYFGPPPGKGVIQDLEYAMRTKGGLTRDEDTLLRAVNILSTGAFVLFSGVGSYVGLFGLGLGNKLLGEPTPGFARLCAATGCAYIMGKGIYNGTLHACPVALLNTEGEGRMKMELANMCEYLLSIVMMYTWSKL